MVLQTPLEQSALVAQTDEQEAAVHRPKKLATPFAPAKAVQSEIPVAQGALQMPVALSHTAVASFPVVVAQATTAPVVVEQAVHTPLTQLLL